MACQRQPKFKVYTYYLFLKEKLCIYMNSFIFCLFKNYYKQTNLLCSEVKRCMMDRVYSIDLYW